MINQKDMFKFFKNIFGDKYDRDVKKYLPVVEQINQNFSSYASLTHDQLRAKTLEFQGKISEHLAGIDKDIQTLSEEADNSEEFVKKETLFNKIDELKKERDKQIEIVLQEILPEAFAVVKETARRFKENDEIEVTATEHDRLISIDKSYVRIEGEKAIWKNRWMAAGNEIVWDMLHYDVQLIGGMVLHDGKIAEMMTGEGKTLVATLPAYLNGLEGGVHVITVNDYLARRDSEWVGPIFEFLLLTVDCIDKYRPHSDQRKKAYKSDIVYGTNNEFGFDYLRDNMVITQDEVVQSKHHFAMIDEVDSVLIDDARTPLIISGPVPKGSEDQEYAVLKPHVERLVAEQRKLAAEYLAQAKKLIGEGLKGYEEGEGGMALLRVFRALPKYRPLIKFLSTDGIKVILQKAENFYMQEQSKNMHRVDAPLLFTIEEKNRSVELTEKGSEFLAQGNEDANFFILPDIVSEIQEIEADKKRNEEEKNEKKQQLSRDFSTKSRRLHSISQLLKAFTLFEKDEEYVVMDGQVKIVDEQTGRLMEGRRYSDGLHQALEAKENVKVGDITQTYATITLQNYFRMYHKLAGMTGTAETEAGELWEIYKLDVVVIPTNKPIVRDDKEDLVYKTAREKYTAVIDDIVALSEAGRPILVGTTSVDVSEKLSRMLQLRGIKHNVLNAKQHQREAEVVADAGKPGNVTIATNMAGRGTDIKISEQVKAAGGLAIIGTERHDSRRVDRQLRGRAGRQGDPGSSQFYVSLEDNLMRLFQSDRIAKAMDRLGHKEGDVIQHSMITKSIEKAQKKVEENNFGIRKRLLEYDDVMNIQREAIYRKRNNALDGDRLSLDINNMMNGLAISLVEAHKNNGNFTSFRDQSLAIVGIDPIFSQEEFNTKSQEVLYTKYSGQIHEFYFHKNQVILQTILPVIKNVLANEGNRYRRIALPISDGSIRPIPVSASMEDAISSQGKTILVDIEKTVSLSIIDNAWKEHLRRMDELKDSVQSASFEQKDPLVIYKMEAYKLFENLIFEINRDVTSYLIKAQMNIAGPGENGISSIREAKEEKTDLSKVSTNKSQEEEQLARKNAAASSRPVQKVETFIRQNDKIGRNDLCPCGSGKKFKQCHGK
jgi:preprotein translocase subunit SecA